MKTVVKVLLGIAIVFLSYLCIMSIYTPIEFENVRQAREKDVVARLIDIRKAELEYKDQYGVFTDSMPKLISFVKDGKKKLVLKEGSLTDAQLESGMTERQAVKIVNSGNQREIAAKGLEGFRRDTVLIDVLTELFGDKYSKANVGQMAIIPYSENKEFRLRVNNTYTNDIGITIPLFEAMAPYQTFLYDLDRQEVLNLIDRSRQLDQEGDEYDENGNVMKKQYGVKVGSILAPNNNAGNWE